MACLGSQMVRARARTGAQAPVLNPSFCSVLLFRESTGSLGGSERSVSSLSLILTARFITAS